MFSNKLWGPKSYGNTKERWDNATKMMSVSWTINSDQLDKFRASKVGVRWFSDEFDSEKNTKWQMKVYPNGKNQSNAGSYLLYLHLKSMPKSYGKMMVYYNMRCNETSVSYQNMRIYDGPEALGFYDRTQLLSELSNLNQISFSCNFRILRIEDKDGNPIYEYPLRISSIPKKEQFIWNIDEELTRKMATATVGKNFAADGILSSSGLFSISVDPNECSGDTESEGTVNVFLTLCALPKGVRALKVKYKIIAPQLREVISYTKTLNYDTQLSGKAMGKFQDLKAIKTMKIMAETEILEVFDRNGTKMNNVRFNMDGMFNVHFGNESSFLFLVIFYSP